VRPNLVNPGNFTPFHLTSPTIANILVPPPPPPPPSPPLTRQELIKNNSMFLNFMAILIIIALGYFLYCIYLERKMVFEYLQTIPQPDNPPHAFIPNLRF